MDLSIIIASWNVREKLRENLKALFQSKGNFSFEVFVVDNNSDDNTAETVSKEFAQVKLIANKENLGFAKANNQAIKQAQGEFILLLNPDMKIFPDTLISMINWMRENKQADVAGCCLVDEQGGIIKHVRRFPRLFDQLMIILKIPHLFPGVLNNYLCADFDYTKAAKADSIRGGFFMMRANARHALRLLDERYFLWFEEVDYCRQARESGGEVWYTPAAKCIDYVGQSFKQINIIKAQKYFRASQLAYFKKWHPIWQYQVLRAVWPIGLFIALILDKLNFQSRIRT